MPRGKSVPKRKVMGDPKYNSVLVSKFVNFVMDSGKKTTAQDIVYGAMERLAEKKQGDALQLFERAIDTIRPVVEVRSKRVGGANYQVPTPVPANRQNTLAFRWIITAAHARKGRGMGDRPSAELFDILEGVGGAMKKKEDVNRMAEANKAFAHFARR